MRVNRILPVTFNIDKQHLHEKHLYEKPKKKKQEIKKSIYESYYYISRINKIYFYLLNNNKI